MSPLPLLFFLLLPSFFFFPHPLLPYFQPLPTFKAREEAPGQILDPSTCAYVCLCVHVIYVSFSDPVGVGSMPPPQVTQQSSLKMCERFGGGSLESQIELRSQCESQKLCCSSSADSRSTHPSQRVVPLIETCMFFLLIHAHFHTTLLYKLGEDSIWSIIVTTILEETS